MKEKIIKSYINHLTKDDIMLYAKKNNIILNNNELDIIYNNIKNNYDELKNNPLYVLNKYKNELNINTYNKLYELYTIYYSLLNPIVP